MFGCPVRYMDITEVSGSTLGCPMVYMNVTEGSRVQLGPGVLLEVHVPHLDPFIYPFGHPSMGMEPSWAFMYPFMHLRWVKDPFVKTIFCLCSPELPLKQVGAPTVPSAFIARSGEWSQSQHIHVMSIHVIHANSCQFMAFHGISWHFMSFIVIHVVYVISFHFMSINVGSRHLCHLLSFNVIS
jgi:hypothetical protein